VLNPALATVAANPADAAPPRASRRTLATVAANFADAPSSFFLFPIPLSPFSFLCSCFLLLSPPLHTQHGTEQSSTPATTTTPPPFDDATGTA
jgi:hypothetical protein